jgi:mRNA interferase MazF
MHRGEIWWAEFDERRPVVLLSGDDGSGCRAVHVVEPADVSIEGLGVEVPVGAAEGLPFEGVLRFAFPRPGYTPCTCLTTLSGDDLIEQTGALPAAKVAEIEDAIRLCEQPRAWTPAAAAQFNEIRNALRARSVLAPGATSPFPY